MLFQRWTFVFIYIDTSYRSCKNISSKSKPARCLDCFTHFCSAKLPAEENNRKITSGPGPSARAGAGPRYAAGHAARSPSARDAACAGSSSTSAVANHGEADLFLDGFQLRFRKFSFESFRTKHFNLVYCHLNMALLKIPSTKSSLMNPANFERIRGKFDELLQRIFFLSWHLKNLFWIYQQVQQLWRSRIIWNDVQVSL